MITYKDIRAVLAPKYQLTDDEDLFLRLMVKFEGSGRQQGVSVLEVDRKDGTKMLQLNTPVVPLDKVGPRQCLEWNLFSTVGGLAVTEIDGEPYVVLVDNLFYDGLDLSHLDYIVETFAKAADRLEENVLDGGDWY